MSQGRAGRWEWRGQEVCQPQVARPCWGLGVGLDQTALLVGGRRSKQPAGRTGARGAGEAATLRTDKQNERPLSVGSTSKVGVLSAGPGRLRDLTEGGHDRYGRSSRTTAGLSLVTERCRSRPH